MRRFLVPLLAGAAPFASPLGSAASASTPAGSCPAAFEGPLTPQQIVAAYPPPPGVPDPTGALLAVDRNGDRHLCVRVHADGVRIIVIDNRIPA